MKDMNVWMIMNDDLDLNIGTCMATYTFCSRWMNESPIQTKSTGPSLRASNSKIGAIRVTLYTRRRLNGNNAVLKLGHNNIIAEWFCGSSIAKFVYIVTG
jgi:hypothetical protein